MEHSRIWKTTACWAHLFPVTVHHPRPRPHAAYTSSSVTIVPLHRESARGKLTGTESYHNSERGSLYTETCSHQQLLSLTALRRRCLQDTVPTPLPVPASSPGHPPDTLYTFRSKKTLEPKPRLVFLSNQIFQAVCMQEKPRKISLALHIQGASFDCWTPLVNGGKKRQ